MIRFCQPSDYRFKGRNVWFNPSDVVSITTSDYTAYNECIMTLRDGRSFTIGMSSDDATKEINKALEETKR